MTEEEAEPRWRSRTNAQPWWDQRWCRFAVAWELLEELPAWEGFRLLDLSLRKAWPDYRGAELMVLEETPAGALMTWRVW